MSAYEGSNMQENDQDRKHGFLGHIQESKNARKELEKESELIKSALEKVWHKAQILSIDEFKGWLKGEGYSLIRREP